MAKLATVGMKRESGQEPSECVTVAPTTAQPEATCRPLSSRASVFPCMFAHQEFKAARNSLESGFRCAFLVGNR